MFKHENLNYTIRAYRMALGMTQKDLGASIDKTNVFISVYERGYSDGNGAEADMCRVINERLASAPGGREFYDAKAALILCDIYRKKEGHTPLSAWKIAKKCCREFGKIGG
jgi:DNA-binding XRE family transcriptional regulator